MRKVMAVASGGGHWVELRRIMPAFDGAEVVYVSTEPAADADLAPARYYAVHNVTRRNRLGFATIVRQIFDILRRERPEVVVTTGAAPGLVALVLAKPERMTLSGRLARPVADAWLVQWPHLARPGGPEFWGAVL
jgi:UDP-N-acetylglucosamine:LPS N-acetylglucosamine transferase